MHYTMCSDNVVLNGVIAIKSSIASFYVAEERIVRHYKRKVETRAAYGGGHCVKHWLEFVRVNRFSVLAKTLAFQHARFVVTETNK